MLFCTSLTGGANFPVFRKFASSLLSFSKSKNCVREKSRGLGMELKVGLSELQGALQYVVSVVPTRSALPVLENVLIRVQNGEMQLTATDQELVMTATVPVETASEGEVLLPAKKFFEVVRALGTEGVLHILRRADTNQIEIQAPTGEYFFVGLDPEEFPLIAPEEENFVVEFPPGLLPMIAKKTTFAVSKDEYQPAMTGVLFEFYKDRLIAVATDGYRLVRLLIDPELYGIQLPAEERSLILPARALDLVKKAENQVQLRLDQSYATFAFDNIELTTRLIEESYPAYQSVIPTDNDKEVRFRIGDALAAVRRASLFVSSVAKHLRFVFDNKGWTIIGEDVDIGNKAVEHVSAEYQGPAFEIGFNYRFIEDALVHLSDSLDNEAVMSFSTATRPALINALQDGETDDSVLMLVMPVRL